MKEFDHYDQCQLRIEELEQEIITLKVDLADARDRLAECENVNTRMRNSLKDCIDEVFT